MQIPKAIEKIALKIPLLGACFRARQFKRYWSRYYPPGHFYSPIPSDADIERWSQSRPVIGENSGLEFNLAAQQALVAELARLYREIPFQAKPAGNLRYYFENPYFSYPDAIFLHLLIRHLQPRRIVEVGSGFSSAVMLDTVERFQPGSVRLTFIEPYTERLRSLLRAEDAQRCTIVEQAVQGVDLKLFTALESGDILFIDSSHVSKAGSDVNFLVFEVFPRLQPGVWIHIHDVFSNFDYPENWLREGRAWNEDYLIRAFLMFNDTFEMMLHGPYCVDQHRRWFQENMPDCLKNNGGSLWIRRKK
jgi:predicted O-methyltransferase YrrM